jgi:3,4-dihydroxy 2-butanone 4-phosphate synthase/GTP cyclohydrolase II
MNLLEYFEATGDSQRELARRCGIHEGRMTILKRAGGFPASQAQAMMILRETNGLVTPNDFLPEGTLPKRAQRVPKAIARRK